MQGEAEDGAGAASVADAESQLADPLAGAEAARQAREGGIETEAIA